MAGLGLWRLLGLDTLLAELMPPGREDVPWPMVAAILTIARFCQPSSELHIETTWYRGTALDDLLGVAPEKVHTDRLYAGLGPVAAAQRGDRKASRSSGSATCSIWSTSCCLYDVTSTYFEGQCRANPMAKRGYSRDKRPDCLQVCIALVVTTDGIPLGYEVFAGNRHDSTTVEEIVEAMEKKYGRANRVWVMDRGMVSEENLKFLRDRGGQYIVGTPKAMLRQFEQHLPRAGLAAGAGGRGGEAGARSRRRRDVHPGPQRRSPRERTGDARAVREPHGSRACRSCKPPRPAGRLKDRGTANRRLGRLQEQNWRAARAFDVNDRRRSLLRRTRPSCGSPGRAARRGANGPSSRKAAICCAAT